MAERIRQVEPHDDSECDKAGEKDRGEPECEADRNGDILQAASTRSVYPIPRTV